MRNYINSLPIRWRLISVALAIIVAGLTSSAYTQTDNLAMLIQQTPAAGGVVSPAIGVHRFDRNAEVTITAIPKPGYEFVYWLGDVSDPTANRTIARLDSPKIIIAVFQPARYEVPIVEAASQSAPGGGLVPSRAERAGGLRATTPPRRRPPLTPPPSPPEPSDEFPVPEPIPEPASAVLFALAAFMFRLKQNTGKKT